MAKLSTSARNKLPDTAFAYVDSSGRRRLPIHDEAHVRNALGRFDSVVFEDAPSRERARTRLLNAAKRYGIVPVGFIDGQLRSERGRPVDAASFPTGLVTFLLTDIEGSTALLRQLGDRYGRLLNDVRATVRRAVKQAGGREVDARADEFFAAFERSQGAVRAAVSIQRTLATRRWPDDLECRLRVGIHSGRPTLTDTGYIGLAVHTAARVCAIAHGGQILVSGGARSALDSAVPDGVELVALGRRKLPGLTQPESLFQVVADGLLTEFPPLRRAATKRTSRG
jgi:class 3 adenylate cyclase